MPLVVPGINAPLSNNSNGNNRDEWLTKLVGKKLTDESTSNELFFAKKDLPASHRVVKPGDMTTMDFRPDRLNIHVDDDGTVRDVKFG
ncbi:hypothetical protein VTN49DRAFT_4385 [Thermomyces lanuginosus]|uniref:uncharacterized protein n=1 Tax=Thermomyces lanuginosus TaxID=5541 RepID=UPI0037440465